MNIFSLPDQCFLNRYFICTNFKNQHWLVYTQLHIKVRGKLIKVNFTKALYEDDMMNEAVAIIAAHHSRQQGWKHCYLMSNNKDDIITNDVRVMNLDGWKHHRMNDWDKRKCDLIIHTRAVREHIQKIKEHQKYLRLINGNL